MIDHRKLKYFLSIFLFFVLFSNINHSNSNNNGNIVLAANEYLIEWETVCQENNPVRVSTYRNQTCYNQGSKSYRYTFTIAFGEPVVREGFDGLDCIGTATVYQGSMLQCSNNILFVYSADPIIEKPGWVAVENTPSTMSSGCGSMDSARHLFKLNTCTQPFGSTTNFYISNGDENQVIGDLNAASCTPSTLNTYPRCSPGLSGIVTPPFEWIVPPITYISRAQLKLESFSTTFKFPYTYKTLNQNYSRVSISMDGGTDLFPRPLYVSPNIDIPLPPVINSFSYVSGTTWLRLTYNATNSPTSYQVSVNYVTQLQCEQVSTCTIPNLSPGYQFPVGIVASGIGGGSAPFSATVATYKLLGTPLITMAVGYANQIVVQYTSADGIPGQTYYTVLQDSIEVPACKNITLTQCVITGLPPGYSKSVTVSAVNDGRTMVSSAKQVTFTEPVMTVTVTRITTTSLSIQYSGTMTPTSYSVSFNSIDQPSCSSTTTCTISGLAPGSPFSVSVIGINEVGNSLPVVKTGQIYNIISAPIISFTPSASQIIVNYPVTDGIPNETRYSVSMDGVAVGACANTLSSTCTIPVAQKEYSHNFLVQAINDGISKQNSSTLYFYLPVITSYSLIEKRTRSISFNYTVASDVTYSLYVRFNGAPRPVCSRGNNCTLGGLTPGMTYNITIYAVNWAGATESVYLLGNLYSPISTPTINLQPSPNELIVGYNVTGGIPSKTLYTTKLDDIDVPSCINITDECVVNGIQQPYTYNITVVATNDVDTTQNSTTIDFLQPTMTSLVLNDTRTTSVSFNYTATGNPQGYKVFVNAILQPACTLLNYCVVNGLDNGSNVDIMVNAYNEDGESAASIMKATLYPSISVPIANVTTTANSILLEFSSTGGVPNETLYTVRISTDKVAGCIQITSLSCLISNLSPHFYYNNIILTASNDFAYESIQLTASASDNILYGLQFTDIQSTNRSINSVWTSVVGDNSSWAIVCGDISSTNCQVDNLIPSTFYYVMVTGKNTFYKTISNYSSIKTLGNPESSCTCSVNGKCDPISRRCVCLEGWIGANCDIKYEKPSGGNPPDIIPNPNDPSIIVVDGGSDNSFFTFSLNKIIEKTSEETIVTIVELTGLNWTLSKTINQTIVHPTTGTNITMNQYSYNTTHPKAQSISITFTQILPINNQTIPDYPMEFAGEKFNLTAGSLKYQIDVKRWNFTSRLNVLEIQSSINSPYDECYDSNLMYSGETSTFILEQADGHIVYGRISDRAILDTIPRVTKVEVSAQNESTTIISMIVSHFDNEMTIDPDFSLLINTNPRTNHCDKKSNAWRIAVGVVVGGVALIAAGVVTVLLIKKRKTARKYNKSMESKLKKFNN
ncbi:EGF-like domain-containing protein [Heterostelium album PN500]|uniref:EGF-like domain-containing protein n=1 Tax=Heterostelium pallidum (strain ATCC 26659 / Pp 5 / PN500) TaxID=670386 RepID=D3BLT2_HETP5|nr:EGF-like domain-containing protein [Heterostelium album PN500]EFA77533.1 EGF-like domain-containing protein [Heterostelium album PN500]|eukprot:XP_020429661.1 EGF-like domain-containing protein [Heterostelium album PN500]